MRTLNDMQTEIAVCHADTAALFGRWAFNAAAPADDWMDEDEAECAVERVQRVGIFREG